MSYIEISAKTNQVNYFHLDALKYKISLFVEKGHKFPESIKHYKETHFY